WRTSREIEGPRRIARWHHDRRSASALRGKVPCYTDGGCRGGHQAFTGACTLMFVVDNFFSALGSVVYWALELYMYVVIARALLSWVSPDPWNPIVQFLEKVTEPALAPLRRM